MVDSCTVDDFWIRVIDADDRACENWKKDWWKNGEVLELSMFEKIRKFLDM